MKIAVFGLGYVGLSTAVWLCNKGHTVHGFDIDYEVLEKINSGAHLHDEPVIPAATIAHQDSGLLNLRTLRPNISLNGLHFDLVVIATYTPVSSSIQIVDFQKIEKFLENNLMTHDGLVIKSTINDVESLGHFAKTRKVAVVPEFLRQGHCYEDVHFPSRVVIGSNDNALGDKIESLYAGYTGNIHRVSNGTAALAKLTANTILATKVLIANEVADLIDRSGLEANSLEIAQIVGDDPRIGNSHMLPSMGLGGACLPKDLGILGSMCERFNGDNLIASISQVNEYQRLDLRLIGMEGDYDEPTYENAWAVVVIGGGFKDNSLDNRGMEYLDLPGKVIAMYEPRLTDYQVTKYNVRTIEELNSILFSRAGIIAIVNTNDMNLVKEVLDAIPMMGVYDPGNKIDRAWYSLAYGTQPKLFQHGIGC